MFMSKQIDIRSYYFSKLNIDVGENYMEQFTDIWSHSDLKTMAQLVKSMIFQKIGSERVRALHLYN